jgi:hypothetical protein
MIEKYSNIKFHENLSPVEAEFHGTDGRTHRNRIIIRLFVMLLTRIKMNKTFHVN